MRVGVVIVLAVLGWATPALAQLDLTRITATPELGGRSGIPGFFATSTDGSRQVFEAQNPDGPPGLFERQGDATRQLLGAPVGESVGARVASDDARTVAAESKGRLTSDDTDDLRDVYLLRDGQPVLLTPGTDPQGGSEYLGYTRSDSIVVGGLSTDGARVLFTSPMRLAPEDGDDAHDVYVWEAGTATLLSKGAEGVTAHLEAHSADGRTVVYATTARVTGDDADDEHDLYAVTGGQTRKVTPGNGPSFAELSDLSADGSQVLFATGDRLTADDTDDGIDLYRSGPGGVQRVTTGPRGDTSPASDHRKWTGWFMDEAGHRVAFYSLEALTHDDADTVTDLFVWDEGSVTRASQGPSGGNAQTVTEPGREPQPALIDPDRYVSDGHAVFFRTAETLTPDDTDGYKTDLYEHRAGLTRLVSTGTGPAGDDPETWCTADPWAGCPAYAGFVSRERVVFSTRSQLVPEDTDGLTDVYQRAGGVTTLLSPARAGLEWHDDVNYRDATADGSAVFLYTEEPMTADDQDRQGLDIYRVRPPAPPATPGDPPGPGPGTPGTPPGTAAPPGTGPGGTAGERLRVLNRPRHLRLLRGRTRIARRGAGIRLQAPRRLAVTVDLLRGRRRVARLRLTLPEGRSTLKLGARLARGRRLRPGRYTLRVRGGGETASLPVRLLAPRR